MRRLYFILLGFALFACRSERNSQSTEGGNIPVIRTIEVQVNEDAFSIKNKKDNFNYIILETTANNAIDRIIRLVFFDEYIIVLDNRSKLFLFNTNGSFISEICGIGRGPGESLRTLDVLISESDSSIHILDKGSQKLIIKDFNFQTLSEHKIPFHTFNFLKLNTGEYWFLMNNQVNISTNHNSEPSNLIKTNDQLEIMEYKLPIKIQDLIMADFPSFSRVNNGAVFSLPLDNNIYRIEGNNLYRYEVSFGKHNLPESLIRPIKQKFPNSNDKYKRHLEILNSIGDTDYAAYIASVLENENYIYFQFEKNRKYYAVLFNKDNLLVENGKTPAFFRQPMILNDKNQIISVVYPHEFNESIELEDRLMSEELKGILQKSKEIDNPIIEIVQLN